MDPRLIIFQVFLFISIGGIDKIPKAKSFNNFVIKKNSSYTFDPFAIKQRPNTNKNESYSIMHKMTQKEKLALFCKIEHEVMQASGFAVKFRLGDQAYVDQLEGK